MRADIRTDFEEALNANIELDCTENVLVVIDEGFAQNMYPVPENTIVFWVTTQPDGIYNEMIKAHPECYTYLLTMFPDLLKLPNAHYFMGCTTWFTPDPNIPKKFGVSTVMSGRMNLPGHLLRREFFERREEVTPPLDFYSGTRNGLPEVFYDKGISLPSEKRQKVIVFDCMFHVVFASFKRWGFFSEKIVDCFATMTVPIFWGCTNIGDHFNLDGIIIVDNVDGAIDACNSLTEDDYYSRIDVLKDNYQRGLEYYSYEHQLGKTMKRVLNKNR